jgi:hypothetical protein
VTNLASSTDLIVDGYDSDAIDKALSWATSVIEGYCNRTFGLVTGDVAILNPARGSAMLPNYPVVNITSVEGYLPDPNGQGMTWVTLTNYWSVPDTGELYDTTGLPGTTWGMGASWPWMRGSLRVTYDHGYDPIPSDLRDVCARLAVQYLENPAKMVERRVGDMEGRFSGSAGALFDQFDRAVLDTYSNVGVA